uniref:Uncharacterized protein n=1 Tax=Arundo donax TaxID=35708 RepID=A0A0A8Y7T6_ARUDO
MITVLVGMCLNSINLAIFLPGNYNHS